ncbi:MAG: molybdate ABC transporter permease subunit [Deltaproteobacteria bacterium]|nr:MAG: molybdate ABC transporter permease subunit [Deltaproteobacteria bacterium]
MTIHPLWLSLKVTFLATLSIFVIGLSLAIFFARRAFRGKMLLESLVHLPLVLPPSVVGYYLLLALGRGSPLYDWAGVRILFTWQAAVVAATVVGLPLMFQASRAAIANVDPVLENAARTLGASEGEVLWRITLPLARRGIVAGIVLGATRALGEFGATLMIAGNIPGRTQTLPVAIYDAVQNRDYATANRMVLLVTLIGCLSLWAVRFMETRNGPSDQR